MKISVSLLLCLTGSIATAGVREPLQLPELVPNDGACTKPGQRIPVLRTKLESTEVWVLHQCGARIADTELWSNTGNGWGLHISATIRDDGKIINDPRLQIRLLYEATSYGTGFDSRPVLLHRVDTLDWGRTRSQVDVCSHREISYYDRKLRKRETGTVLSCSPTTVECPASGCVEPTFVNGVLTMQSASGPVTATHRR